MRRVTSNNNDKIGVDNYLTIVALEDGLTAKLSVNACEYCVDGNGNWKSLPTNTETESINAGQTLSFRGNLTPTSSNGIGTFTVNKYFNLKGNCMSMLFGDNAKESFSLEGKDYAFYRLFRLNNKLIHASDLVLPAKILSNWCYFTMFENCISLLAPPKQLATELSAYCYAGMYKGCSSLIDAPELPATMLSYSCYGEMFRGCSSLIVAPELKASKLVGECYRYMFYGCSNLNYIKALFTNKDSTALSNWVNGVSPTGMFVKSKDATFDTIGISGIPEGWTVITE